MEEKIVTVYARLEPPVGEQFRATLERERRTMQAVVEMAIIAYIEQSRAAYDKAQSTSAAPA